MSDEDLVLFRNSNCNHPKCIAVFDEEAAKGLDAVEVRRRWPRFEGRCPDCLAHMIVYASFAHCVCGDW